MRSVMNITDILKPAEHIPTGLKKNTAGILPAE